MRSERFELPTLGFEVRCSIQLSYERVRGRLPDLAGQGQQPAAGSTRASGGLWRRRLAKNLFPTIRCPQVRQCRLPSSEWREMVRIRSEVAASSLLVLTIEKSIFANGLGSNAHALQRGYLRGRGWLAWISGPPPSLQ